MNCIQNREIRSSRKRNPKNLAAKSSGNENNLKPKIMDEESLNP